VWIQQWENGELDNRISRMTADRTVSFVRYKIPREEEVQEDPRIPGPTAFLQETGYQPNRRQERKIWCFQVTTNNLTGLVQSQLILILWILKTVGRTSWTGDQPVAMLLRTQENTNVEKTQTSGIRTQDLSVRACEIIWFLRRRGHFDRLFLTYWW
jgi:hypothetical protein